MAIAIAFTNGPTLLGGILGGCMAAAMFLTAALDLCLPCYVFVTLFVRHTTPAHVDSSEAELQTTTPLRIGGAANS